MTWSVDQEFQNFLNKPLYPESIPNAGSTVEDMILNEFSRTSTKEFLIKLLKFAFEQGARSCASATYSVLDEYSTVDDEVDVTQLIFFLVCYYDDSQLIDVAQVADYVFGDDQA